MADIINYEKIQNMSKLELANFLSELRWEVVQGKSKYPHIESTLYNYFFIFFIFI